MATAAQAPQGQNEDWLIVLTVGTGIRVSGTLAEAEKALNDYYSHVEKMFKDNNLHCFSKGRDIKRRIPNGG